MNTNDKEELCLEIINFVKTSDLKTEDIGAHFNISGRQVSRIMAMFNKQEEFKEARKQGVEYCKLVNIADHVNNGGTLESYPGNHVKNHNNAKLFNRAFLDKMIPIGICKMCGLDNDYSYKSGLFCSEKCARGFSTKYMSEESKEKRLIGFREEHEKIKEEWNQWRLKKENGENPDYPSYYKKMLKNDYSEKLSNSLKKYWDNPEKRKERMAKIQKLKEEGKLTHSEETREKLRKRALERVANGTHVGWTSRGKRSYAEKYWDSVLTGLGIDFIPEYVVNKRKHLGLDDSSNYFLDMLIVTPQGIMINLEIDGKQHKYKDRAESDRFRDYHLRKNNFVVYRIPWVNPSHDENTVNNQIDDFKRFISNYGIYV